MSRTSKSIATEKDGMAIVVEAVPAEVEAAAVVDTVEITNISPTETGGHIIRATTGTETGHTTRTRHQTQGTLRRVHAPASARDHVHALAPALAPVEDLSTTTAHPPAIGRRTIPLQDI